MISSPALQERPLRPTQEPRAKDGGYPPLPHAKASLARSWTRKLMDKLEDQHFWFAIFTCAGLLVGIGTRTINSETGGSLLGLVIGHYLGKQAGNAKNAPQEGNTP